jgi:hypothetical protein
MLAAFISRSSSRSSSLIDVGVEFLRARPKVHAPQFLYEQIQIFDLAALSHNQSLQRFHVE